MDFLKINEKAISYILEIGGNFLNLMKAMSINEGYLYKSSTKNTILISNLFKVRHKTYYNYFTHYYQYNKPF